MIASKRKVPASLVIALTTLFGCTATTSTTAQENDARPNIIIILADDLGYGEIGAYGQTRIRTPAIDRMAAEGMRFTDAYSGAPICAPSRMALLTGRHTGNQRANTNVGGPGNIQPSDVTIAEILKAAGYRTALIGKYGLGEPGQGNMPEDAGFDVFTGYVGHVEAHRQFPGSLWREGERRPIPENAAGRKGVYAQDILTRDALAFVGAQTSEPFFLLLTYTAPHADLDAPADAVAEYSGAFAERAYPGAAASDPFSAYYPAAVSAPKAVHAAMITRMDRDVGRILDALRSRKDGQDTLVIFTSDNGPHREGGADPNFFHSSGPLRGIKRDLYEGGIRVPFVAWRPGEVRAGSVSDTPIAFWDFLSTAADLARAPEPVSDGISFAPLLSGSTSSTGDRKLYWEFGRSRGGQTSLAQAMREGSLKAVRYSEDASVEVYDLTTDIGEQIDISARHPEFSQAAKAAFDNLAAKRKSAE